MVSKIIYGLLFAFIVRYFVGLSWVESNLIFFCYILIVILSKELITLLIDTLNVSKKPFKFAEKIYNRYFTKIDENFFKYNNNIEYILKTKIIINIKIKLFLCLVFSIIIIINFI